ncbi:MAG: hypothetical protein ACO2Y9_10885 [Pseudohongiellaceae bacterium]
MKNLILIPLLIVGTFPLALMADQPLVFLAVPYQSKAGTVPACTALNVKESSRKAELRDANKSWPKAKIDKKTWDSMEKYADITDCLNEVTAYEGRFDDSHVNNLMLGNLTPGMPSEFAFMLLGPAANQSMSSYMDPMTGKNRTFTYYIWNNKKRMGMLGAALTVAGAATGLGGAAGSIAAVQAGAVATSVASTAYSLESLKSYRIVTIGADETGTIQTFSSN